MPTKNPRIATYLPQTLFDLLKTFKANRAIDTDSQAVITILSEYFGVSQEVAQQSSSLTVEIEKRIEVLEERLTHLKSELLSELEGRLSALSPAVEEALNSAEKDLPSKEGQDETASELSSSSVNESLELSKEVALSSSPLVELPETTKRKRGRPKGSGVVADGSLTTADLARRLQMDGSSLSHWKPGRRREKTQEEMLEVTRKADPEGIGWVYIPEVNRFKPERSIAGSSSEILQSELLSSQDL